MRKRDVLALYPYVCPPYSKKQVTAGKNQVKTFPRTINTCVMLATAISKIYKTYVEKIVQTVQRLATGWTVRGSNPGGGQNFPHPSRPALGPTQPTVQWVPGLSRGKERQGRNADPSPPSSTMVMKGQSYSSTPPMGRTACTEPQCLYMGDLYLTLYGKETRQHSTSTSLPCQRNKQLQEKNQVKTFPRSMNKCVQLAKTISEIYKPYINTLRTGLLNCLNARSRGLIFRHRASCIQGQAFRYSPENAFHTFNQQIYFIT